MINNSVEIIKHDFPFKWIEFKNIFDNKTKSNLLTYYPTDNYRTIIINSNNRKCYYYVRAFLTIDNSTTENYYSLDKEWYNFANFLRSDTYFDFINKTTGIDISDLNLEVNIYKYPANCFMDAHRDLDTKILTQVFYFNDDDWKEENGGCLNILKSKDENDVFKKVLPIVGNSVILIRSDNSWHSIDQNTLINISRRSVTATFYKKEAKSPMWITGEKYELYEQIN